MNNFGAVGQEVFHAHLHVIPRYYTDGHKLFAQASYKPGDREKTGEQLRRARKAGRMIRGPERGDFSFLSGSFCPGAQPQELDGNHVTGAREPDMTTVLPRG